MLASFAVGVMAFFRNAAGHKVIEDYSQEDTLRFVAWIDLLLDLIANRVLTEPAIGKLAP